MSDADLHRNFLPNVLPWETTGEERRKRLAELRELLNPTPTTAPISEVKAIARAVAELAGCCADLTRVVMRIDERLSALEAKVGPTR